MFKMWGSEFRTRLKVWNFRTCHWVLVAVVVVMVAVVLVVVADGQQTDTKRIYLES